MIQIVQLCCRKLWAYRVFSTRSNYGNKAGKSEKERVSFYQSLLAQQIIKLEDELKFSLQDMPVIISGMASSNIGMTELPYKELPFGIDGQDLYIKNIQPGNHFRHLILLASGVRTGNDVMRGEETQLMGCFDDDDSGERLFIFPGTHSKHVWVADGQLTEFKTYMTGEFFNLLSRKSILSNALEENSFANGSNLQNFEKGILDSLEVNILHGSFLVRTNYLFKKLSKEENYHYLSGLLIGTESKELTTTTMPLTVVGNELLNKSYHAALVKLGINKVTCQDAGEAIIKGHDRIYRLYTSKLNSRTNSADASL